MTLSECTSMLATLAAALRADVDEPTYRAYHRVLEDVPAKLLQAACDRIAKAPRREYEAAFPDVRRLRAEAEGARLELLAAVPYVPCADCQGTSWATSADGRSVTRCPCRAAHLAMVERSGLGTMLSLPAGEPERAVGW